MEIGSEGGNDQQIDILGEDTGVCHRPLSSHHRKIACRLPGRNKTPFPDAGALYNPIRIAAWTLLRHLLVGHNVIRDAGTAANYLNAHQRAGARCRSRVGIGHFDSRW